jgi:limonene-1,2-epoxide hydrolase
MFENGRMRTEDALSNGAPSVVREFFASMERRDWSAVEAVTADHLSVWWPVTLERFEGRSYVDMNRAYPEGWHITVHEVVGEAGRVAARVRVDQDDHSFWCFGFYLVVEGLITAAIESWVEEGSEPAQAWRAPFRVSS